MKDYREQLNEEFELRNLSECTRRDYLKAMKRLLEFTKKDPVEIQIQDIKDYLLHFRNGNLLRGKSVRAPSTVNKDASGIIFYYHRILSRHQYLYEVPKMKRVQKNPTVLSRGEVQQLILSVNNTMYKAILMLLYSTGLRQSELRNLKIKDIDNKRMIINIRSGKGGKDRQAILTPQLLDILRKYWAVKKHKKSKWIFNPANNPYHSDDVDRPLSHSAVSYILKVAKKATGIKKDLYPHCLRHTYAVHLLEAGTNLRHVQFLMGHACIKSTIRYTLIADIKTIVSPNLLAMEDLGGAQWKN